MAAVGGDVANDQNEKGVSEPLQYQQVYITPEPAAVFVTRTVPFGV